MTLTIIRERSDFVSLIQSSVLGDLRGYYWTSMETHTQDPSEGVASVEKDVFTVRSPYGGVILPDYPGHALTLAYISGSGGAFVSIHILVESAEGGLTVWDETSESRHQRTAEENAAYDVVLGELEEVVAALKIEYGIAP